MTPVYLCGTHAVGTVYEAAVLAAGAARSALIPVVGECDDGDMADSRTSRWRTHSGAPNAGTDVAEGTVGAGTGMICFDFPAASARRRGRSASTRSACSCSATPATAPLDRPAPPARSGAARARPRGLLHRRLCDGRSALRASASAAGAAAAARAGARRLLRRNGSGEIGIAFSTTREQEFQPDACRRSSRPRTRPPRSRSTTAWSRPNRARAWTAGPHEAFPKHLVKR